MIDSIINDIKRQAQSGNMVTRIIMINVAVFVVLNLVYVFDYQANGGSTSFYSDFRSMLVLPSEPSMLLKRFWTMVTYMFTHKGFFHIFWNMLLLYWFGRIYGDYVGDHKVLPLYLTAGLVGGMFFILMDLLLPIGSGGSAIALGASAAVMGVIFATATLSPDYEMRLLLIGSVKIKWIALVLFVLDIIGTSGSGNEGGHFAHIGGALFGYMYIIQLRRGTDMTAWLQRLFNREPRQRQPKQTTTSTPKPRRRTTHLKVSHRNQETIPPSAAPDQEKLDAILDKIKAQGYDNLTQSEKDYLNLMSNS